MGERVEAPFTPEQVAHINAFQAAGYMHPFTCPYCSGGRDLIAAEEGLRCPNCDYRQAWVHDFMADGSAVAGYDRMFAATGLPTRTQEKESDNGG